jgi:hypothetical protein
MIVLRHIAKSDNGLHILLDDTVSPERYCEVILYPFIERKK